MIPTGEPVTNCTTMNDLGEAPPEYAGIAAFPYLWEVR